MPGIFRSWAFFRWVAFLFALVADVLIFHYSVAFSPMSYMASGLFSLTIYLVFLELAMQMRGRRRIRKELETSERKHYQVGKHLFVLLRSLRANKLAYSAIWFPVWISIAVTVAMFIMGLEMLKGTRSFDDAVYLQYMCAGYWSLLVALPFTLEHVAEWRSHQYALIVDKETSTARLIYTYSIFDYNIEDIALERSVKINMHQKFFDWMFGIGTVEIEETSGGENTHISDIWRPNALRRRLKRAILAYKKHSHGDEE